MDEPRAVRDLERLKWLGIALPIAFVWAFEVAGFHVLDGRMADSDTRLVSAVVLGAGVIAFGVAMAVLLDRTQRHLVRQNHDLTIRHVVGSAIRGRADLSTAASDALETMVEQTGALAGVVRVTGDREDGFVVRYPRALSVGLDWLQPLLDEEVVGQREPSITERRELDTLLLDLGFVNESESLGGMRLLFHPPLRPEISPAALIDIAGEMSSKIRLSRATADLERRHRERAALYEVALQLTGRAATPEVLDTIARHARDLLGADRAAVCLADDTARRRSGHETDRVALTDTGETELIVHVGDGPDHPPNPRCPLRADRLTSRWASSPVRGPEGFLGELCVARDAGPPFSDGERRLLGALADMAAIAVRTARLDEAQQQWVILSERDRIARELHDSMAQVLGHIHLQLRALQAGLNGASPSIGAQLDELATVADEAYCDVREAILGLRETISSDSGLEGALREYVAKYRRQTGINVTLECDGAAHNRLPPRAEVQLLRVVQEALTNVRKHARATRATVRIALDAGLATLTVEDDGAGFDPARIAESFGGGFGLTSMRERVEQIGGSLTVDTAPGRGTRVVVRFGREEASVAPATAAAGTARR